MTGFREKVHSGISKRGKLRKSNPENWICENRITRAFNRGRTHSNENATAYLSLSALDKAK